MCVLIALVQGYLELSADDIIRILPVYAAIVVLLVIVLEWLVPKRQPAKVATPARACVSHALR